MFAFVITFFRGKESSGYTIQIGSLKKQSFFPTKNFPYRIKPKTIVKIEIIDVNTIEERVFINIIDHKVEDKILKGIENRKSARFILVKKGDKTE